MVPVARSLLFQDVFDFDSVFVILSKSHLPDGQRSLEEGQGLAEVTLGTHSRNGAASERRDSDLINAETVTFSTA